MKVPAAVAGAGGQEANSTHGPGAATPTVPAIPRMSTIEVLFVVIVC